MALTLPQSFYDDLLSAFPDAEGSTVSATITASGGTTSIKSSLGVSVNEQGTVAETVVSASATVEADGTELTASGDAAASGETVSTSFDLVADVDAQGAETSVSATAEAEAEEGGTAIATASTDANVEGPDLVISKDQSPAGGEATEIGDHPTIESSTYLEAVRVEDVELGALQLALADEDMGTLWSDVDWSL